MKLADESPVAPEMRGWCYPSVDNQVWDPAEKKQFDVDACNADSIDECVLAGYDKTEQWDCGGNDLESYPVDWRSEDDKAMCAARPCLSQQRPFPGCPKLN
eukprot:COSAG02_NODE_32358_length_517_cov_1.574163_2_plen_100_part_01